MNGTDIDCIHTVFMYFYYLWTTTLVFLSNIWIKVMMKLFVKYCRCTKVNAKHMLFDLLQVKSYQIHPSSIALKWVYTSTRLHWKCFNEFKFIEDMYRINWNCFIETILVFWPCLVGMMEVCEKSVLTMSGCVQKDGKHLLGEISVLNNTWINIFFWICWSLEEALFNDIKCSTYTSWEKCDIWEHTCVALHFTIDGINC